MLNLDTHILILAINGELRRSEQAVLTRNPWSVSAIVLWELAKLVQLKRLDMDLDDREVVRVLSRLHVWRIDLAVAQASTRLDFRGDPADEIIAATSVVHGVPLVTRDRIMRGSKVIPRLASVLFARTWWRFGPEDSCWKKSMATREKATASRSKRL